jgi:hypothetical protein
VCVYACSRVCVCVCVYVCVSPATLRGLLFFFFFFLFNRFAARRAEKRVELLERGRVRTERAGDVEPLLALVAHDHRAVRVLRLVAVAHSWQRVLVERRVDPARLDVVKGPAEKGLPGCARNRFTFFFVVCFDFRL